MLPIDIWKIVKNKEETLNGHIVSMSFELLSHWQ